MVGKITFKSLLKCPEVASIWAVRSLKACTVKPPNAYTMQLFYMVPNWPSKVATGVRSGKLRAFILMSGLCNLVVAFSCLPFSSHT